jgi:hypothetical protein
MIRLVVLSAILSISLFASSQQKIEVEIGEKAMSKGQQMAISILIPDATPEVIESLWKKYVKDRSISEKIGSLASQVGDIFKSAENQAGHDKRKVEKNGDELFVRSIEETTILNHSMDVYARMTKLPEGCIFSTFFQYTDSVFINESNIDPDRLQNLKSYVRDFGVIAYQDVVDEQIKEAKKDVSKQENVLKDFESDIRKEGKTISRCESDSMEFENEVLEIQGGIKVMDESIQTKKTALVSEKKGTENYDRIKSELKDMDKEKSKNFNKIKSLKSKIKSKGLDIKSAKSTITELEKKMEIQRTVIAEKEQIVEQLVQKKDEIK